MDGARGTVGEDAEGASVAGGDRAEASAAAALEAERRRAEAVRAQPLQEGDWKVQVSIDGMTLPLLGR